MILDDASMDRLVRAAAAAAVDSFVRPPDVVVRRYLLGTASVAERHQVREALEQSAAFRREVLELAEAADEAIEKAGTTAQSGARPSRLPEWVLAELKGLPDPTPPLSGTLHRDKAGRRLWERLHMPVLAPLALAALLVLFLVARAPKQQSGITTWGLVPPAVEKEELISMGTRSNGSPVGVAYKTAREAALAEMRKLVRWNSREFEPDGAVTQEPPMGIGRKLVVRFANASGGAVREMNLFVPSSERAATSELNVWILAFPQRQLRAQTAVADTLAVRWEPDWGSWGCVTATYLAADGYQATTGHVISF